MYYQTGSMRQFNNDLSPGKKSNVWQRENEFQYAQLSKYQKSQVSYGQQQRSKVIYNQQKTDRYQKYSDDSKQFSMVPIKIKSPEFQDRKGMFRIQIQKISQKNGNSILMYLTNDSDSLFLWNFLIRENQFAAFKTQQHLRIDFHQFPLLIDQFFNLCIPSQQDLSQNKAILYELVFEIAKGNQQAEMKVIQMNKFKQSCHLNLKFKKANDEQTKIYLSQKYDKEKKQKVKLQEELSEATHKLNLRMQEIEKLNLEYDRLRQNSDAQINELKKGQKQKIKELTLRIQQQNLKKQKYQNQTNKKRSDELNSKIQQLKVKYQEVYGNYQKANERIINLQASQSSLKSKNAILQQQNQNYQKQNKQLKAKQLKLNEDYHLLRNQNTKLSCNIQSLQDRLKQKDQRITQNIQVKTTNVSQISTLQQNLRQEKKKVQKLQQKIQSLQGQIDKLTNKNQDIYSKLQKKKANINQYKQIMRMQQDDIVQHEKSMKKMTQQILQLKRNQQKSELDLKDRQSKIKILKDNIQQNQQNLEQYKKIISQLNKKLNQKSIGAKVFPLTTTLPTYPGLGGAGLSSNPIGSTSIIGREYSSTVSSTSESRLKYSPSPIAVTSPLNQKITQRIVPPFRKYRQGVENDRDQQNSHHSQSHSRSPIANRLNQQLDPEQADKTKEKIGPIKFRK